MVAEYTRLNVHELEDMDYDEYLYWFRDAYIHKLNQTEEGRKYLENAYYFTQTKPDRTRLRENFGRK